MARLSAAENTLVEDAHEAKKEFNGKRRIFKVCSIHNKKRLKTHLVKNSEGKYVCKPTHCCIERGTFAASVKAELRMCSKCDKRRHKFSLVDDGKGGYVCTDADPCRLSKNFTSAQLEKAVCSRHGKKRSMYSLRDDGEGGYVCIDSDPCFTAERLQKEREETVGPTLVQCSLHLKMRSMNCMEADGKGGFHCRRRFRCMHQRGERNYHGGHENPAKAIHAAVKQEKGKGRGKGIAKGTGRGYARYASVKPGSDDEGEPAKKRGKVGEPRRLLTSEKVEGSLTFWGKKHCIIEPDEEVDHPAYEKQDANITVRKKDLILEKGEEAETKYPVDCRVLFNLYVDGKHIVCGEVEPLVK